ncbi:hypothetical protein B9G69_012545 [Bdellovibrio sp. SKB1291214]|uniref:hypothetical protein n=1 Tax=Bdellovibrio sp. SKB1291214 TaxID=1732569 RepID=UPI000B517C42|nr:hypothetical protein [Bdellovibrio sp. SKB1291214]UYL07875.1 hypothetical protein B9G69_012545 [Bdellovibrio sp. SKB1291214]
MIKYFVFCWILLGFVTSARAVPEAEISEKADSVVEKLDVTDAIQALFKSDVTLSRSAQNIGIIQKHSTLILRGTVKSAEEKKRVGKIAEDAAEGLTVINDTRVSTQE